MDCEIVEEPLSRLEAYAQIPVRFQVNTVFDIETQNINVRACRFYAKQGCELGAINRFAYSDFPEEVQLIWYYRLM